MRSVGLIESEEAGNGRKAKDTDYYKQAMGPEGQPWSCREVEKDGQGKCDKRKEQAWDMATMGKANVKRLSTNNEGAAEGDEEKVTREKTQAVWKEEATRGAMFRRWHTTEQEDGLKDSRWKTNGDGDGFEKGREDRCQSSQRRPHLRHALRLVARPPLAATGGGWPELKKCDPLRARQGPSSLLLAACAPTTKRKLFSQD
ncbi:hypothetical protein CC80DRAFT_541432 [Byssothecium circinans]|uniref:Uncharacterized protein n=1 Tax=Byssothecium circinans TaxID=147558 RepID=A0A6A5UFG1_9PLEO|nr:hypothetical protein CC80DRAFT_541432 [Byssothecium circinans]